MTAESRRSGTILVDGEGMTLYMFVPDAQGPSTCEDDCLAAWPALTGPATAGEGVDEALLGTATRPDDGTEQVTYNGWPLYTSPRTPRPATSTARASATTGTWSTPTGTPIGMD